MLLALVDQFPGTWDEALPWVLFASCEVPVETLGCSTFDLLFGRSFAGPLALLKSARLHKTDLRTRNRNFAQLWKMLMKLLLSSVHDQRAVYTRVFFLQERKY